MSEWKHAPLGELVKIQKGKLSVHADFPRYGYLPVINTETISGKITVWGEPSGSVVCDENDLLL
ncbi:MAG: restriction endonuclease subunit S [Chlorobium sp.]|jgi:hypothetical protein|nr:restriction endonuclease subunit S [Chlorobium sp.]